MPRSRGAEMANRRQTPRTPLHLRPAAASEVGSLRHPATVARRSPREQINEKKRGSRVAELETSLNRTMEELRKLKEKLVSVETAETDARKEIEKLKNVVVFIPSTATSEEDGGVTERPFPAEHGEDSCLTWDAEVVTKEVTTKEVAAACDDDAEAESKLEEPKEEPEIVVAEKEKLEMEAEEANAARENTRELQKKLNRTEDELQDSQATIEMLKLKLLSSEESRASLEAEMKHLRVQSEQWRKAAEAAMAALVTGDGLKAHNL
ncbi:hypothetical protein HPP92_024480 [Vanilla planifolia]|uniref:Uncharacterized protein n=1 Tax=Vanilla planifolia TaxID=51239 RepID=A0A835PSB0_VANPL|nr:hypothetical protein HPP92_024480 [Vanilla planifolia]